MRARIDVSEIEAKTKIRAKYLRALENEEWGLLPGPTFVKSFLRTYAQALGLDGKALVEEYRLHHERPSEAMLEPIVSTPQSRRREERPALARSRALARLHDRGERDRRGDRRADRAADRRRRLLHEHAEHLDRHRDARPQRPLQTPRERIARRPPHGANLHDRGAVAEADSAWCTCA